MANELVSSREIDEAFETVSALINEARIRVANKINSEIVMLYWSIGKTISEVLLHGEKPDYGRGAIEDISAHLTLGFGRGFDKTTVHRIVQLYQKIAEEEKVATLSQQLSWSHSVELLSIQDDLKRPFSTKVAWLKSVDNSAIFSSLLSATLQRSRRAPCRD